MRPATLSIRPLLIRPKITLPPVRHTSHIPSQPTWSTHSLLDSSKEQPQQEQQEESITPTQLHHLLRLSALPLPRTASEEASLLRDLHLQLRFVRRVQACDTRGVEPLRAVRDETEAAKREATVGLEQLLETLKEEVVVGHYQRPRRVRDRKVDTAGVEDWDPLQTASRKAGRYFAVKSGKEAVE